MVHFIDGRQLFAYIPRNVALNTTPLLVLKPNPARWGVLLSDSAGGALSVSIDQAIGGANAHFFIGQATTSQPTLLNWDNVGPIIMSAWYICRQLSGASNLGVVEIIYQPPGAV